MTFNEAIRLARSSLALNYDLYHEGRDGIIKARDPKNKKFADAYNLLAFYHQSAAQLDHSDQTVQHD